MFGLTPLGIFHTVKSLIAVGAGAFALIRDKQISGSQSNWENLCSYHNHRQPYWFRNLSARWFWETSCIGSDYTRGAGCCICGQ